MPGILDLMGHIQQQGEMGRVRGQQNKLAGLYSQAFSAPREQRQGLLSQIAAVSPDSAQAATGMFDNMDDNARAELGQYAAAFSALPDDQKASAYPQLAQQAASLGLPVPQGGYRPEYAQGIAQLAQAFGGAGGASGVQSTYVDATGNRVAIMRDGSTRVLGQNDAGMSQQTLTITGPDGRPRQFTFDKRTGGYMPAQLGGTQPMEVPFSIDPRLPPEVQEAIRNHPDAGSAQGITSLNIPGGSPFVGRAPEEQAALTTAAQQRTELGFLPQRQAIETQGAIERTRGTEQAKADIEREQGEPARQEKVRQTLAKTANLTRTIDDAIGRVNGMTAGFIGSIADEIPGTPANDLRVTVNTIKANLAFDALQAMREASPTGGALGAVSERELALLESAVASLDQSQTPAQMREALQNVKRHYQAWEQAVRQADREAGGSTSPAVAQPRQSNDPLGIL